MHRKKRDSAPEQMILRLKINELNRWRLPNEIIPKQQAAAIAAEKIWITLGEWQSTIFSLIKKNAKPSH
jgi:hypothetical protein